MKLQQLKYLLAIVDNGMNITAAAERMYTSQPGVSKQLKLLEEELGLQFDEAENLLRMCWTVSGGEDFRQSLDDMCMNLNELTKAGASIEVTFYDTEFDQEDGPEEGESRDDFLMLFVGPSPAAIMQVQRDLLVSDVIHMMERHFDGAELGGVVAEIDKLFSGRFDALVNSMRLDRPPRGPGGNPGHDPGAILRSLPGIYDQPPDQSGGQRQCALHRPNRPGQRRPCAVRAAADIRFTAGSHCYRRGREQVSWQRGGWLAAGKRRG